MKLIESSVSLVDIANPFMKIEKVGRTCYKSTSEMTEETAKKFVAGLIKRSHFAMLEHAVFVFQVSESVFMDLRGYKFFNYSIEELENGTERYLISANLRALNESGENVLLSRVAEIDRDLVYYSQYQDYKMSDNHCKIVDIDSIPDIQEHAYKVHKHLTFHFICDRGVTHEIVRHRPASYAQESTRYCNYAKDKFGSEITCIYPADWGNYREDVKHCYERAWKEAETSYNQLIDLGGASPQQARAVLPNALKTEIIMTANCKEFEHFFNLRSRGTTGAPHPDMKRVADIALGIYTANIKLW